MTTTSASATPAMIVIRHGQLVELARERRLLLLDAARASREIWPTSVAIPVAVTTISPRPRVTVEFM